MSTAASVESPGAKKRAQDAWLERVLGITLSPRPGGGPSVAPSPTGPEANGPGTAPPAPPPPPQSGDIDKRLQETLLLIKLKIAEYADNADQETEWLKRADEAQAALQARDPAAPSLIETLGKELTAAADRLRKAEGPWKEWHKAVENAQKEAGGLKQALLSELSEHGLEASASHFETGWSMFEDELSKVGDVLDAAHKKVKKMKPAEAAPIVAKAVKDASKAIDSSTLLKDIDGNDALPVTVVAGLRKGMQALERAIEGAKP